MKNIFFSIMAIMGLFIGLSAFNHEKTNMAPGAPAWFEYQGDLHGGGYNNKQNYDDVSSPSCTEGSVELCAIYVQSDGSTTDPKPDATALNSMQSDISQAFQEGETADIKLRDE